MQTLGLRTTRGAATLSGREQPVADLPPEREASAPQVAQGREPDWTSELSAALKEDRLELDFQPILGAADLAPAGYELLVRLRARSGKRWLPGSFLPSAERSGLSADIDRWVLERAANWLVRYGASLPRACRLSINVAAPSLARPSFADGVRKTLRQTGISGERLCLELTESAALDDLAAAAETLSAIRALGCAVALDDFGTGFCSLDYLHALPVDIIKIDGIFVRGMLTRPVDHAIVRSVITLGHALDLRVVAEYVEDMQRAETLDALGVDFLQGFVFGHPRPLSDLGS